MAIVAAPQQVATARWRLLLRRPTFLVGAAIVLFWVVCAIFGQSFAPYNPLAQNLLANNAGPSGAHWFGTDQLGRDVLSRVIVGARDHPDHHPAGHHPRHRSSAPRSAWPWATSAAPST